MNTMLIKSIYGKGITAFKPSKQVKSSNRSRHQVSAKVGLFYSTSTGNTQAAAEWIQEKFAKHGDIAALLIFVRRKFQICKLLTL